MRGGQPRNINARKMPFWAGYELDTRDAVDQFIQDTIRATWTGELGTRKASAINGAVRLLLESRHWFGEDVKPRIPPEKDKVGAVHAEMIRQYLTYDEKVELYEVTRWQKAWDAHSESTEQLFMWIESLSPDEQKKVEEMSVRLDKLVVLAQTRYEEELAERVREVMEQLPELRARLDALREEDAKPEEGV